MAIRNKTTAVLMAVFVLALAAGVVAGTLVSRLPVGGGSAVPLEARSPLTDRLRLNETQRDQMRGIWEDVRKLSAQCLVDGQRAQKDRDDQIFKILTPEQKVQWDVINTQFAGKLKALSEQREAAFRKAVERTLTILSPEQRKTYQEMIDSRVGAITPGGGFGQPPPSIDGGPVSGSTNQRSP